MKQANYVWMQGSRLTGNVQVVGKKLMALQREHGEVTPEIVVASATPKGSPLHQYFTWDDAQAAQERRLDQARAVIRFVGIKFEGEGEEDEPIVIRAFFKKSEDEGYGDTITLMSQADSRGYVLARALAELESFQVKYGNLLELAGVMGVIDKVKKKLKRKGKHGTT